MSVTTDRDAHYSIPSYLIEQAGHQTGRIQGSVFICERYNGRARRFFISVVGYIINFLRLCRFRIISRVGLGGARYLAYEQVFTAEVVMRAEELLGRWSLYYGKKI